MNVEREILCLIVKHWNEFGPEHGIGELMDQAEVILNRDVSTEAGRAAYVAYVDSQDIHCNRFPSWAELSPAERTSWEYKATMR